MSAEEPQPGKGVEQVGLALDRIEPSHGAHDQAVGGQPERGASLGGIFGPETTHVNPVADGDHLGRGDLNPIDQPTPQVIGNRDDTVDKGSKRSPEPIAPGVSPVGVGDVASVFPMDDQWNAGQFAASRATDDSAAPLVEAQSKSVPQDAGLHGWLALLYAGGSRREDALREAQRYRDITQPEPGSTLYGYWVGTRLSVDLLTGKPADAVAWLDTLLRLPGGTTREYLKIDPVYAPLRGRPDFERLVAGKP